MLLTNMKMVHLLTSSCGNDVIQSRMPLPPMEGITVDYMGGRTAQIARQDSQLHM